VLPSYVERTSYGIKESNPYNKLYEERVIFLGVQVDDASANDVMAQLLHLEHEDPDRDIVLYINSPGGSFTSLMAIYDTMNFVSAPVSTFCVGQEFASREDGLPGMVDDEGKPKYRDYADYIELESAACSILTYSPQIISGILQTEDYAQRVVQSALLISPPGEVTRRVRVRMERQERRDTKPELALRSALHRMGLRFRVDRAPLPDMRRRADVVFGPGPGED
jgi:hypothetical protein